jgi:hypothetical protein
MRFELLCPACGVHDFDFDNYETLALLAPNLALTQFCCPRCGIHLSATLKLTPEMRRRVQQRLNAEPEGDGSTAVAPAAGTDGAAVSAATPADGSATAPATEAPSSTSPSTPPEVVLDASLLSYAASLVVEGYESGFEITRPLRTGSAELKAQMEYFKRQLDGIETVDQAIAEIDTGYYHEKRDV